jgi:phosphoadenosine phosphosulfate reductase
MATCLPVCDLDELNRSFEGAHPEEILAWAVETFGADIAASSSFQTQGVPLLHMISRVKPDLPILFLDTGYHFPETLAFRDQLVQAWGLSLRVVRAVLSRDEFVDQYGHDLYRRDPDLCCHVNKVEPMQRAVAGLRAWISGIRRDQSSARAEAQILELMSSGEMRVHPMATWRRQDVWRYIHQYNLPEHPLLAQGYLSIGCAPCTRPVYPGEDERGGRWVGQERTECGLHTLLREMSGGHAPESVDVTGDRGR